mmetsp:Transcript_65276/g.187808  ORF Transcript_65276/g.187808 Transcript_65276/m.187808 type:complete len:230 (-) Transcript_65276:329-1018(-)
MAPKPAAKDTWLGPVAAASSKLLPVSALQPEFRFQQHQYRRPKSQVSVGPEHSYASVVVGGQPSCSCSQHQTFFCSAQPDSQSPRLAWQSKGIVEVVVQPRPWCIQHHERRWSVQPSEYEGKASSPHSYGEGLVEKNAVPPPDPAPPAPMPLASKPPDPMLLASKPPAPIRTSDVVGVLGWQSTKTAKRPVTANIVPKMATHAIIHDHLESWKISLPRPFTKLPCPFPT